MTTSSTGVSHLQKNCNQIRRDIVRMVHSCQSGHPGGSLGCTEFFVALYFKIMKHDPKFNMSGEGEDIFFLSNGHISPVWYFDPVNRQVWRGLIWQHSIVFDWDVPIVPAYFQKRLREIIFAFSPEVFAEPWFDRRQWYKGITEEEKGNFLQTVSMKHSFTNLTLLCQVSCF